MLFEIAKSVEVVIILGKTANQIVRRQGRMGNHVLNLSIVDHQILSVVRID